MGADTCAGQGHDKQVPAGSLLHLLGRTDSTKHNQLYSAKTAVGLIVANGHVGPYLNSSAQLGTYLSRDAGKSWSQIGQGSRSFEIANHGAITLFAEDSKPITELKYSWTQGAPQTQCSFTSTPMTLADIATEPDNTARTFIMYGSRGGGKVRRPLFPPPLPLSPSPHSLSAGR